MFSNLSPIPCQVRISGVAPRKLDFNQAPGTQGQNYRYLELVLPKLFTCKQKNPSHCQVKAQERCTIPEEAGIELFFHKVWKKPISAFCSSQPTSPLLFRILIAYHSPKITCVPRLTSCSSLCNSLNLAARHVWLCDRAQGPGKGPLPRGHL